jgi:hypothetical protein
MKRFIILVLLFESFFSSAQVYSKVIPDPEILSFINYDIKTNNIKAISSKLYPLNINDFYYKDSIDFARKNSPGSLNFTNFIFHYYRVSKSKEITNNLDTIFSREDIDFFKKQIRGIRKRLYWKTKFANTVFDDDPELDSTNHTKLTVYNYSIPLFSIDRKKVIIIKRFYCGFLCGGGAYNLYIKNTENTWVLFKQMNVWGE